MHVHTLCVGMLCDSIVWENKCACVCVCVWACTEESPNSSAPAVCPSRNGWTTAEDWETERERERFASLCDREGQDSSRPYEQNTNKKKERNSTEWHQDKFHLVPACISVDTHRWLTDTPNHTKQQPNVRLHVPVHVNFLLCNLKPHLTSERC